MQYVNPETVANRNLLPDPEQFRWLQILRDYDTKTRRLLNRLRVEINLY